jgi:hypothetical protein
VTSGGALAALTAAMQAGSVTPPGGQPLKIESLDIIMKEVKFESRRIKLPPGLAAQLPKKTP